MSTENDSLSGSPRFWRVTCQLDQNPGQWPTWYREQCCAVGWGPPDFTMTGGVGRGGWSVARSLLKRMRPGDLIVASLPSNRVGRVGTIVELRCADDQWDPIVPRSKDLPTGENGRRILVRWDLNIGPPDMNQVVLLPDSRLLPGDRVKAIGEVPLASYEPLVAAMQDEANWTSITGRFSMERALSDYIALHPDRLEAGMVTHPGLKPRERVLPDKQRTDVILMDRAERTVIVECKQGSPSVSDVQQLINYGAKLGDHLGPDAAIRLLLVHGGSNRATDAVFDAARAASPRVELVYHELSVAFFSNRG